MTSPFSAYSSLRGRFFAGLLIGVAIGFAVSFGLGWFVAYYHPVEESKVCYAALKEHSGELQPQTREFLKARLYWNAANWVGPSWMKGWQLDFGPIDDAALGGLRPIKDGTSSSEVYHDALARHGIQTRSP